MNTPRVLVFASGSKDAGGSGFQNLVEWSRKNPGSFEVVGVVSNHESGGVAQAAAALSVPFIYFPGSFDTESYKRVAEKSRADYFALSGWLKMVHGLPPEKTFNIHPALLSRGDFGGNKMYGHNLHTEIAGALERGELSESGVSMHFVTDEYDRGPVFFEYTVPLVEGMDAQAIEQAVRTVEHEWQPKITNMVVHGEISWDGNNPKSLKVPAEYAFLPKQN